MWHVLSKRHRSELQLQGFTVVDGLASQDEALAAHDEALRRASAGRLTTAHSHDANRAENPRAEDNMTPAHGEHWAEEGGVDVSMGYDPSVRDDLTLFISPAREAALAQAMADLGSSAEALAIPSALGRLLKLGEDLGKMVRLNGWVEYQLAVYPGGMGARYEKHRDAFPDDGMEEETEKEGEGGGIAGAGAGFRRVTAVLYLAGKDGWAQETYGGALRLYIPAGAEMEARRVRTQDTDGQDGGGGRDGVLSLGAQNRVAPVGGE
ncbi:unnamed protein product, partial [Discosporangium mesarthrocarpum]